MCKKKLSIVVPCYNEEANLSILYQELERVTKTIEGYEVEYVFVDDGSTDATVRILKEMAKEDSRIKYLGFSRNFGKESALLAGLENATGDYVATMDADLQDPPELLPQMLAILEVGEYDNVATRRVTRKGEPPIRSFFAHAFYKMMRKVSDVDMMDGARDYRLMSREMVESILSLKEYNRFSKGIFAWVGYKTKWIEYENRKRVAGETKWSFWKLLHYSIEGIVSFSNVPLTISSYLGLFLTFISFVAIIFIVVRKLIFGDPVDGWASTICIITFIGGIQLFCMGIMGQYLSKTYMEVKRRPHYIVRETNCKDAKKNN